MSPHATAAGAAGHRRNPSRSVVSAGPRAAAALLCVATLGLAGCGESSSEKAAKNVCSATKEIRTQLTKLASLPISTSFPAEARSSVQAITSSVKKIDESAPKLSGPQKQEVEAANSAFASEITTITKDVVGASISGNTQAGLKSAEPQIRAALSRLQASYKKAFEALSCS